MLQRPKLIRVITNSMLIFMKEVQRSCYNFSIWPSDLNVVSMSRIFTRDKYV